MAVNNDVDALLASDPILLYRQEKEAKEALRSVKRAKLE